MKKELNLHGDKYTAYSPDKVNWVVVAEENVLPVFDLINDKDEFRKYITTVARDGIVESIKALNLQITKPSIKYNSAYECNYFDNNYYIRTKIDKQKRRLSYYFYKNKDVIAKLTKFNAVKWISEDFYE